MDARESPRDIAILAALDFPTPDTGRSPLPARSSTRRAGAAAVGVVGLSLVMLILIVVQPFLPTPVSVMLAGLWACGLGVVGTHLARASRART